MAKKLQGLKDRLKEQQDIPEALRAIVSQTEEQHTKEQDNAGVNQEHIEQIKRLIPPTYRQAQAALEKRDKRVVILTQPKVYEYIKGYSTADGVSVNEVINRILIDYINQREEVE